MPYLCPCLAASILGAALLAAASGPVLAQVDRVEVSGSRSADVPRTDVVQACPAIQAELVHSLGDRIHAMGTEGETRLDFRLKGTEISEIRTSGGPAAYLRPLRHVVRHLDCQRAGPENQLYSIRVLFRLDANYAPENMVSLVTPR